MMHFKIIGRKNEQKVKLNLKILKEQKIYFTFFFYFLKKDYLPLMTTGPRSAIVVTHLLEDSK